MSSTLREKGEQGPVEEVLNSVDGNSITVEDPADTTTGNNVQDSAGETPSSGLDEVWTDRCTLIFDVDDRPPLSIAFVYALQLLLHLLHLQLHLLVGVAAAALLLVFPLQLPLSMPVTMMMAITMPPPPPPPPLLH
ncbi:hypothetical protein LSAT2_026403 [Lamellibrachia satsuma]|nr:hypothetical protein LSAT2_026403 [Lamellibrachia satsuma]